MNKTIRTFLFFLAVFMSVAAVNGIIWIVVRNTIGFLPSPILIFLALLGRFMWLIIPVLILGFLRYKGKEGKLSDNQISLKIGAIWSLVILAILNIYSYLS